MIGFQITGGVMKGITFFLKLGLVLLVVCSGCQGVPPSPSTETAPDSATTPALTSGTEVGTCQQIVLTYRTFSRHGLEANLVSVCPDGTERRRLTSDQPSDTVPTWSPEGRWIAFTSDRSGTRQLHLMDENGSNLQQLTFDLYELADWLWMPEGDRIVFRTMAGDGVWKWQFVNINTKEIQPFSEWPNGPEFRPAAFSHDGSRLLYLKRDITDSSPARDQIRIRTQNGSRDYLVTAAPDIFQAPAWSPDETQIAFVEERGGSEILQLVSISGESPGPPEEVFSKTNSSYKMYFAWSPEGDALVINDGQTMFVMNLVSGEKQTLFTVDEPNQISHLSWEPK